MKSKPLEGPVVLFDGVCNFCNAAVNFIIDRDKRKIIRFAALQSDTGRDLLKEVGMVQGDLSTMVLIENGKAHIKSTAALRITRYLDGLWKTSYAFLLVPRILRDLLYNFIASNRYRWFGKRENCRRPTPDIVERFIE